MLNQRRAGDCNLDLYKGPRISTVSRHRQARRSPRAPPAGGVPMSTRSCHYILTGVWSRVARTPWNMTAAPTGSPNIIGLEYCHSDDACMPLDQSAVNCCLLIVACKVCIWIWSAKQCHWINGCCQYCFGKVRLFLPCKFKGQFKILVHKKMHKISILFRQYLWQSRNHVSCETGLKGVRFCANASLKVQCVVGVCVCANRDFA